VSGLEEGPLQKEWPDRPAGAAPKRQSKSFFRELPFLIIVALVVALLVKTFLVQAFFIPSESMEPTLHGCAGCRGDRVLVNRLVYRFRDPRRGEIIVFAERPRGPDRRGLFRKLSDFMTEGLGVSRPSSIDYVKRIIGLPGETVQMKDGIVTVTRIDKKKFKLIEPYLNERDLQPFGPKKVPAGEYFVMGDNRTHSADSRTLLGTIRREDIIGKAFVKIWPPGRMGRLATVTYRGDAAPGAVLVLAGLRRRRRLGAGMTAAGGVR
jgi:signal peptidase I